MKRGILMLILLALTQLCPGCASWDTGSLTGDELDLRREAMDVPNVDGQRERGPRPPTEQR
ncbi:MAG: hypothetical protein FJ278_12640 [Planctomycetes bacterium]|nr:hypothetical protein [Planctomycetota bacterium]